MKGSLLASFVGYKEAVTWNRKRLEECTDLFVCPSRFMAEKMAQGGFRKDKLKVLCNFIDVEKCRKDDYAKQDYYCYVGRLSHEKGVGTLVEAAARLPYKLKIIGGGPLSEEIKGNVEFLGFCQWNDIKDIVGKAKFTVIPSEWYENNPLSVIEAECLGTPVLGARIGGIPELIDEDMNGMTFESGNADALADAAMKRYNDESYYGEIKKCYIGL